MGLLQGILDLGELFGSAAYDAVGGVLGWAVGMFANFVMFVAAALPSNPLDIAGFMQNQANWNTGIEWLNWFVPVGNIELMMVAWVGATLVYYGARYVFNFIGKRFFGE